MDCGTTKAADSNKIGKSHWLADNSPIMGRRLRRLPIFFRLAPGTDARLFVDHVEEVHSAPGFRE